MPSDAPMVSPWSSPDSASTWNPPDEDQWLQSATIIMTSDNPEMHDIDNPMPGHLGEEHR